MSILVRSWVFLLPASVLLTAASVAQDGTPAPRALPSPVLVIGTEGEPDYEFLRIWTAVLTASGNVAVVDAFEAIRVYGPTGRLLRKLGRSGEGPGEFRRISELFRVGDTLVTYDFALRRLTWYSILGPLIRTARFHYSTDQGSLRVTGRLSNGQWVVESSHSPSWANGPGVYRDTTRIGILPASATGPIAWLGEFPGMTFFVHAPPGRQSEWRVGMLPYSPLPIIATWRDSVIVGDLGATEVTYYTSSGRPARTLQLPRLAATRNLGLAREEAFASERDEAGRSYTNLAYDAAKKARSKIWERLVVADNGDLWISVADPSPTTEPRYLVLAPSGAIRAAWLLPPRSRLLSVSGRELLVATRDANDIERVARYRL